MSYSEDERSSGAEERAAGNASRDDADVRLLPLRSSDSRRRFEDTSEWKWTRTTCAGLFRALGRYYDELWFPTALHEWCMLYYQCNHVDDYWQRRDAWLAGDEQIRVAVWSEVLAERSRRDQQMRTGSVNDEERRTVDPERILEMRKVLDEANDRIVMKRMEARELECHDKEEPTAEEKARAETEAAEIALADPSEDPNWVVMRRRMRGSFAALNLGRCDISSELLNHMMIELCNYWRNLPCIDYQIEPLLERNIIREIQNFRFRLFGKPVVVEPDYSQSCPSPEQDVCREPSPDVRYEQASDVRCEPEVYCEPAPEVNREPAPAKKPKSRASSRGPATNKLVEARAKQNAARIKALESKKF